MTGRARSRSARVSRGTPIRLATSLAAEVPGEADQERLAIRLGEAKDASRDALLHFGAGDDVGGRRTLEPHPGGRLAFMSSSARRLDRIAVRRMTVASHPRGDDSWRRRSLHCREPGLLLEVLDILVPEDSARAN